MSVIPFFSQTKFDNRIILSIDLNVCNAFTWSIMRTKSVNSSFVCSSDQTSSAKCAIYLVCHYGTGRNMTGNRNGTLCRWHLHQTLCNKNRTAPQWIAFDQEYNAQSVVEHVSEIEDAVFAATWTHTHTHIDCVQNCRSVLITREIVCHPDEWVVENWNVGNDTYKYIATPTQETIFDAYLARHLYQENCLN